LAREKDGHDEKRRTFSTQPINRQTQHTNIQKVKEEKIALCMVHTYTLHKDLTYALEI
jgi:hypothetical protein